jgi:hypothetical protein
MPRLSDRIVLSPFHNPEVAAIDAAAQRVVRKLDQLGDAR